MSAPAATAKAPIVHATRNYQKNPESGYCLPSDEPERARLLHQHNLLKKILDDRVIYAPVNFTEGSLVLDSGSGSGTWITDAAARVPAGVSLYGVDIESRLFPANPPPNVRFSVGTVTSLPADWSDTFDLINQRLLICALTADQWRAALTEMFRVLTPGGYVQLGEAGRWHAGEVNEHHYAMILQLFASRGLLGDCAEQMVPLLREIGFEDIQIEEHQIPLGRWAGQDGIDARSNWIDAFRGMKTPILNAGGFGFVSSEEELDALTDNLEREWDETPGAAMPYFIFTARKPLSAAAKPAARPVSVPAPAPTPAPTHAPEVRAEFAPPGDGD